MSIIITGLEMPTERESFTVTIKYNGLVFDAETGIQLAEAHEIPPHGRLGDLDKLIARYEKQKAEATEILCDERAFSADYERARYMYARAVEFISALKSQAAVIPADYADKG